MKSSLFGCIAAQLLLAVGPVSALRFDLSEKLTVPPLRADEANAHIVSEDSITLSSRADKKSPIIAATFDQLIDHANPDLGTFKQRYWYNAEYYGGPGAPIVLQAPTEAAADGYTGYTTNRTLSGAFAQAINGVAIVLEHRYWGDSSPYDKLTTTNMQYLTLDNAMLDLTYFAKNVKFPFDPEGESKPDKAPWVLTGCSYAGALAAWVHALEPGTFWTYHCSSAVVEVIDDLWQYYKVVEEAMPRNCSADVQRVMRHVDGVLTSGTDAKKEKLKKLFGLEILSDYDFATGIQAPMGAWQGIGFDTGYNSFHRFCDYVENRWPGSTSPQPDEDGVGLCKAVKGYAKWFKEIAFPGSCASYPYWNKTDEIACYISDDDSPIYTDMTVRNPVNRQWEWMLCNEPFKWWQTALPDDQPHVISNFSTPDKVERQCGLFFPPEGDHIVGIDRGKTTKMLNDRTGGWNNVNTTRLMWANGGLDPWKPATVSSNFRPGGPLKSTPEAPVRVLPGAAHCGDLLLRNAQANEGVMEIYQAEVQNIKEWVGDFYKENDKKWPGMSDN